MDQETRTAIEDLQRRVAALESELALSHSDRPGPASPTAVAAGPASDPEVRQLIAQNNQIAAIKLWRSRTGMGLAEAKHDVDLARAEMGL